MNDTRNDGEDRDRRMHHPRFGEFHMMENHEWGTARCGEDEHQVTSFQFRYEVGIF